MNYGNITLPLTLNDVGQEELYEGDFTSKEYIIWTLDFTLKAFLYGPTNESKVIKEIFVNFKIPDGDITTSAIATTETEEHIYIRPGKTAGNTATSNAAASVAVANINSTDAYGFIVEYIRDADA